MAGNMRIEQIAELRPAFPTFSEAVGLAAQQIVRRLGIASWAAVWSDPALTYGGEPNHPPSRGEALAGGRCSTRSRGDVFGRRHILK